MPPTFDDNLGLLESVEALAVEKLRPGASKLSQYLFSQAPRDCRDDVGGLAGKTSNSRTFLINVAELTYKWVSVRFG
jgi:hypothetical protein